MAGVCQCRTTCHSILPCCETGMHVHSSSCAFDHGEQTLCTPERASMLSGLPLQVQVQELGQERRQRLHTKTHFIGYPTGWQKDAP